MKKLLYAFDTNNPSTSATFVAQDLAKKFSTSLTKVRISDAEMVAKQTKVFASAGGGNTHSFLGKEKSFDYHLQIKDITGFLAEKEVDLLVCDDTLGCAGNILHFSRSPVLMVPSTYRFNGFHQISYIADIRYSHSSIIDQLHQIAAAYKANLALSHISLEDIPHPSEDYMEMLFDNLIGSNKSRGIRLNNIRERDVKKTLDVLIHAMGCDLAVLANRQFHFDELSSKRTINHLVHQLSIPVLVFPS